MKSFVANLLKIKPLIQLLDNGTLIAVENIRTFKKAIQRAVESLKEVVEDGRGVIQIYYTDNEKDLKYTEKLVNEVFPDHKVEAYTLPATVVAHLGTEAIAVGYVNHELD